MEVGLSKKVPCACHFWAFWTAPFRGISFSRRSRCYLAFLSWPLKNPLFSSPFILSILFILPCCRNHSRIIIAVIPAILKPESTCFTQEIPAYNPREWQHWAVFFLFVSFVRFVVPQKSWLIADFSWLNQPWQKSLFRQTYRVPYFYWTKGKSHKEHVAIIKLYFVPTGLNVLFLNRTINILSLTGHRCES